MSTRNRIRSLERTVKRLSEQSEQDDRGIRVAGVPKATVAARIVLRALQIRDECPPGSKARRKCDLLLADWREKLSFELGFGDVDVQQWSELADSRLFEDGDADDLLP